MCSRVMSSACKAGDLSGDVLPPRGDFGDTSPKTFRRRGQFFEVSRWTLTEELPESFPQPPIVSGLSLKAISGFGRLSEALFYADPLIRGPRFVVEAPVDRGRPRWRACWLVEIAGGSDGDDAPQIEPRRSDRVSGGVQLLVVGDDDAAREHGMLGKEPRALPRIVPFGQPSPS